MTTAPKERLSARINPDLTRRVRDHAAQTRRTVTAIYEDAVQRYLGIGDAGAEWLSAPESALIAHYRQIATERPDAATALSELARQAAEYPAFAAVLRSVADSVLAIRSAAETRVIAGEERPTGADKSQRRKRH